MSDQLLELFKLLLLGLIWLFFFRVLRMVWLEVSRPAIQMAAGTATTVAAGPGAGGRVEAEAVPFEMVVLAPTAQAGRRYSLAKEVTMGRAPGCAVVIDDTYASQMHARCFVHDGQILVEDLGSTNGTLVNGHGLTGPTLLAVGDQISIGETLMELR